MRISTITNWAYGITVALTVLSGAAFILSARSAEQAQPPQYAMVSTRKRARLARPSYQQRHEHGQDDAIVERQQGMRDPFGRREQAGSVFLDEIPQRDGQFDGEQDDECDRPAATGFEPAECDKEQGIE